MDRRTAQILTAGLMCLVKDTAESGETGKQLANSLDKELFAPLGEVVGGYALEILMDAIQTGEDTTKRDLEAAAAYMVSVTAQQVTH